MRNDYYKGLPPYASDRPAGGQFLHDAKGMVPFFCPLIEFIYLEPHHEPR